MPLDENFPRKKSERKPRTKYKSDESTSAPSTVIKNESELDIPKVAEYDVNSTMLCPRCDFTTNQFKYLLCHFIYRHKEFHKKLNTVGINNLWNCF